MNGYIEFGKCVGDERVIFCINGVQITFKLASGGGIRIAYYLGRWLRDITHEEHVKKLLFAYLKAEFILTGGYVQHTDKEIENIKQYLLTRHITHEERIKGACDVQAIVKQNEQGEIYEVILTHSKNLYQLLCTKKPQGGFIYKMLHQDVHLEVSMKIALFEEAARIINKRRVL